MDIRVFDFPTDKDNINEIERRYTELLSQYRRGEPLDEIEIDWMDTANTWLLTSRSY